MKKIHLSEITDTPKEDNDTIEIDIDTCEFLLGLKSRFAFISYISSEHYPYQNAEAQLYLIKKICSPNYESEKIDLRKLIEKAKEHDKNVAYSKWLRDYWNE